MARDAGDVCFNRRRPVIVGRHDCVWLHSLAILPNASGPRLRHRDSDYSFLLVGSCTNFVARVLDFRHTIEERFDFKLTSNHAHEWFHRQLLFPSNQ